MILGDTPDGANRQGKFAVGGLCVMASFNHRPPPVQLEQRREGNKNTNRHAQVLSGYVAHYLFLGKKQNIAV